MAKILIVDDDEYICVTLRALLEADGLAVDTIDNVPDALHMALRGDYAVIVMDVRLPEMNGMEGLRAILTAKPGQNIIGLTGMAIPNIRDLVLEAGGRECLFKPGGVRKIPAIVRELLASRTEKV